MIQAHVICCNDFVEYVFIGTKSGAQEKCKEMRDAANEQYGDDANYCPSQHWHIHTVDYEQEMIYTSKIS